MQVLLFLPIVIFMNGDLALVISNKIAIQVSLNAPGPGVDISISLQYLFTGMATLVFGYLSDKMSRKLLLVIGGAMWVVGLFMTALSINVVEFIIFRCVAATALGCSAPVSFSLLSDIFQSEKRSNGFAWWGVANTFGGIAGGGFALAYNTLPYTSLSKTWGNDITGEINYIFTTPSLRAEAAKWTQPFFIFGIIATVCLVLVLIVREPKRAAQEKQLIAVLADKNIDYSRSYRIRKQDLKYIIVRKSNIFLILNFFATMSGGLIVAYLVTYLTFDMGFTISFASAYVFDTVFLFSGVVVALGLSIWFQFYLSKRADKAMAKGDNKARIKMLIICSFFQNPFFILAFLMTINVGSMTIFRGAIMESNAIIFWIIFYVQISSLGIGLAGSFGGTNCWYSSIVDVNLPEHRGTMIAVATMLDAIGRALGLAIGAFLATTFENNNVGAPHGMAMMWMTLVFGNISALMVLPLLKTWNKDYTDVTSTLAARAEELKAQAAARAATQPQETMEQRLEPEDRDPDPADR